MSTHHRIVDDAIRMFGGRREMREALGVSTQAVTKWKREGLPQARVTQIIWLAGERKLKIPESLLKPPRTSSGMSQCSAA